MQQPQPLCANQAEPQNKGITSVATVGAGAAVTATAMLAVKITMAAG